MSDYVETTSNEYVQPSDTNTLQIESEGNKAEVNIEEQMYGINKPHRIIIRAKISHD